MQPPSQGHQFRGARRHSGQSSNRNRGYTDHGNNTDMHGNHRGGYSRRPANVPVNSTTEPTNPDIRTNQRQRFSGKANSYNQGRGSIGISNDPNVNTIQQRTVTLNNNNPRNFDTPLNNNRNTRSKVAPPPPDSYTEAKEGSRIDIPPAPYNASPSASKSDAVSKGDNFGHSMYVKDAANSVRNNNTGESNKAEYLNSTSENPSSTYKKDSSMAPRIDARANQSEPMKSGILQDHSSTTYPQMYRSNVALEISDGYRDMNNPDAIANPDAPMPNPMKDPSMYMPNMSGGSIPPHAPAYCSPNFVPSNPGLYHNAPHDANMPMNPQAFRSDALYGPHSNPTEGDNMNEHIPNRNISRSLPKGMQREMMAPPPPNANMGGAVGQMPESNIVAGVDHYRYVDTQNIPPFDYAAQYNTHQEFRPMPLQPPVNAPYVPQSTVAPRRRRNVLDIIDPATGKSVLGPSIESIGIGAAFDKPSENVENQTANTMNSAKQDVLSQKDISADKNIADESQLQIDNRSSIDTAPIQNYPSQGSGDASVRGDGVSNTNWAVASSNHRDKKNQNARNSKARGQDLTANLDDRRPIVPKGKGEEMNIKNNRVEKQSDTLGRQKPPKKEIVSHQRTPQDMFSPKSQKSARCDPPPPPPLTPHESKSGKGLRSSQNMYETSNMGIVPGHENVPYSAESSCDSGVINQAPDMPVNEYVSHQHPNTLGESAIDLSLKGNACGPEMCPMPATQSPTVSQGNAPCVYQCVESVQTSPYGISGGVPVHPFIPGRVNPALVPPNSYDSPAHTSVLGMNNFQPRTQPIVSGGAPTNVNPKSSEQHVMPPQPQYPMPQPGLGGVYGYPPQQMVSYGGMNARFSMGDSMLVSGPHMPPKLPLLHLMHQTRPPMEDHVHPMNPEFLYPGIRLCVPPHMDMPYPSEVPATSPRQQSEASTKMSVERRHRRVENQPLNVVKKVSSANGGDSMEDIMGDNSARRQRKKVLNAPLDKSVPTGSDASRLSSATASGNTVAQSAEDSDKTLTKVSDGAPDACYKDVKEENFKADDPSILAAHPDGIDHSNVTDESSRPADVHSSDNEKNVYSSNIQNEGVPNAVVDDSTEVVGKYREASRVNEAVSPTGETGILKYPNHKHKGDDKAPGFAFSKRDLSHSGSFSQNKNKSVSARTLLGFYMLMIPTLTPAEQCHIFCDSAFTSINNPKRASASGPSTGSPAPAAAKDWSKKQGNARKSAEKMPAKINKENVESTEKVNERSPVADPLCWREQVADNQGRSPSQSSASLSNLGRSSILPEGFNRLGGFFGNRPPPPTVSREAPSKGPMHLQRKADLSRFERLKRTVKSLLNKLTIDKFSVVAEKIALEEEAFETVEELDLLADLVFEKAVSEPEYSQMYADLCLVLRWRSPEYKLADEQKGVTFHRCFVNRCQDEFEAVERNSLLITEAEKAACETEEDEDKLLKKKKTRILGNMRFIGELFLRRSLSAKVLNDIVDSLVFGHGNQLPDEHYIECLTELLSTIGFTLDMHSSTQHMLNQFLQKLEELQRTAPYSKRIVFKIQDLLDLRMHKWKKKVFKEQAKSVAQIREDAIRDELMGGSIHVAQEGTFAVMGLRREQPYSKYIEEQRQLFDQLKKARAAGAATSVAPSKSLTNPQDSTPLSDRMQPCSPSSETLNSTKSGEKIRQNEVPRSPGIPPPPSSAVDEVSLDLEIPLDSIVMRNDLQIALSEVIVENGSLEEFLKEWNSFKMPVLEARVQFLAMCFKAADESHPQKAPLYASVLSSILVEQLNATQSFNLLLDTMGRQIITNLHDFALDNPCVVKTFAHIIAGIVVSAVFNKRHETILESIELPRDSTAALEFVSEIKRYVYTNNADRIEYVQTMLTSSCKTRFAGDDVMVLLEEVNNSIAC